MAFEFRDENLSKTMENRLVSIVTFYDVPMRCCDCQLFRNKIAAFSLKISNFMLLLADPANFVPP